jgi:hypothetical protein
VSESQEVAHGFIRHGASTYVATFAAPEREVLINLTEQIIELLAERVDGKSEDPLAAMVGITGHDSPPDDEVLRRLLPDAYSDPVESAEFRRYTESVLRSRKRAHAMAVRSDVINAGDQAIELSEESAQGWLGALNDIRLALGVRLNVENRTHEQLEILAPDDPMRAVFAVYTWLGWLQSGLIDALFLDIGSNS